MSFIYYSLSIISSLETLAPWNLEPFFEQVKKSIYHTCITF